MLGARPLLHRRRPTWAGLCLRAAFTTFTLLFCAAAVCNTQFFVAGFSRGILPSFELGGGALSLLFEPNRQPNSFCAFEFMSGQSTTKFIWRPARWFRTGSNWHVVIALWPFMLMLICATGFWHWQAWRPLPPRGFCSNCGYDLRGNPAGRCPECGRQSGAVAQ